MKRAREGAKKPAASAAPDEPTQEERALLAKYEQLRPEARAAPAQRSKGAKSSDRSEAERKAAAAAVLAQEAAKSAAKAASGGQPLKRPSVRRRPPAAQAAAPVAPAAAQAASSQWPSWT